MRRRRRRSSFSKPTPGRNAFLIGAACIVVVAGFVYFMHQAEVLAPAPHDVRLELTDAAKQ